MASTLDRIIKTYAFTPEDKQQLTNALAQAYLLAKAQAYQRAQSKTAHVIYVRKPWQVSESEVKKSQQWAAKQVESIAETYETLLRHAIEELPEERAIGDVIGGIKSVVSAIGDWISSFLTWKVKQIADNTWSTGDNAGTEQFIEDVQGEDNVDELADDGLIQIRVRIEPGESSSDYCKNYAGEEYSLEEYQNLGISWPAHTNCIHSAQIFTATINRLSRSVNADNLTYLFLDIDGVLSVANAGLPEEMIDGKEAWPVPLTNAFLRTIVSSDSLQPMWMTHWGKKANGWCNRAGIEPWRVWFPLSSEVETDAKELYPELDRKVLAIQFCMYVAPANIQSAVWLQDGFTPEEQEWAEQAGVRLVNANEEPIHSLLLSEDESTVQRLMDVLVGSFAGGRV